MADNSHETRGDVGNEHRDEERADLARTPLSVNVVLLLETFQAADAAAEDDADAVRIVHPRIGERGIGHRLSRAGDRVLRVSIRSLRFLPIHVLQWIEALHLARETNGELGRVELRDGSGARYALDERAPGRRHVVTDGRNRPETGDDDPTFH